VSFFLQQFLKKWLLVASLLWMPIVSAAADLGSLHVHSALGDPLKAEIEIVNLDQEELKTLSVSVAAEQDYASVGLNKLASHDQIMINIANNDQGKPVAFITSNDPMDDPFLNVIFQIISHKGKVIREYAFLLDPPIISGTEITSPTIENAQALTQEDAPQSEAILDHNEMYYEVLEDETLVSIVKKMGYEGMMNRALLAFYRINPDAFENDDIHQLKPNAKLQVPSLEEIQSENELDANQFVEEQTQNWEEYQAVLAKRAELDTDESDEEIEQSSAGLITTENPVAEKLISPKVVGQQDVVKLSKPEINQEAMSLRDRVNALQDDLVTQENSILEANKRAEALQNQLEDMQKLLIMKDQKIEALTKNTASSSHPELSLESIQSWVHKYFILGILCVLIVLAIGLTFWKNKVKQSRQALLKSTYQNSRTAQKLKKHQHTENEKASNDAPELAVVPGSNTESEAPVEAVTRKTLALIKEIDFDLKDQPGVVAEIDPNPNNSELNLSAISLDFNPKASPKKKVKFENVTDMNMQIDLAAAYVDMGDKRRARQLLNKVMKEGDAEHQHKAQEILNQIA
jgi:FimV-like protein